MLVRQYRTESTDNMCVHCLQIQVQKGTLIVSQPLYLYQTEGDTNLSECHPCFVIPLLMTKPPSTSCLGMITKDIEEWINVLSLCLSVTLSLSLWVVPVWQTWRPRSVCHKLNYAYIRHMVSLPWENKNAHTHSISQTHTHKKGIPQKKTSSPSKASLNSMVFSLMPDVCILARAYSSQQPPPIHAVHFTSIMCSI